jgi:hypothetical protein
VDEWIGIVAVIATAGFVHVGVPIRIQRETRTASARAGVVHGARVLIVARIGVVRVVAHPAQAIVVRTGVRVIAVGRDETVEALRVLVIRSTVTVIIDSIVADLGHARMYKWIRIIAVVPAARFAHIRIPIRIHGKPGTGSVRAGIVHGAGIPIVARIGVVRVVAHPAQAIVVRTGVRVIAVGRDETVEALRVLVVRSTVTVVIDSIVTDLGHARMYKRLGIIAVVAAASFAHIRIPVRIHGKPGTGSVRAGVVHGAGIPIVTRSRVVRALTGSADAIIVGARVPVIAVGRDRALVAVRVLAVRSAVTIIIAAVVTDLGRPGVDEGIRIVTVIPAARFTHIRIPVRIHGKPGTAPLRAGVARGAGIHIVARSGVVCVLADPVYAVIIRTLI